MTEGGAVRAVPSMVTGGGVALSQKLEKAIIMRIAHE